MAEEGEGEDGEGEGGVSLDKAELKKLFKIAAKKELAFAFVPGSGEQEGVFTIHRRFPPKKIAKAAKDEAEKTKVAFGKIKVDGKTVTLTCDKELPGMKKKLEKMLRQLKVPMEVTVVAGGAAAAPA